MMMKQENRAAVLKLIRRRDGISRADLARLTGLTRPTVSSIVSELTRLGLVIETGKGESSGGKRPILLRLNSDSLYAIGIDLADEDCIRGVACTLGGRILGRHEEEYTNCYTDLLESSCRVIERLLNDVDSGKIQGIGFSVSGVVDESGNEVVHSSNFDIENRGLAKQISERFSLPVLLANRPNAAALAEKLFGVGRNFRNLVYLTTGLGFGAGIIRDGAIFSGSFGSAGEIGKMILDPAAETPSVYPNTATLEYRIRAGYMLETIRAAGGPELSYRELLQRFQAGDPLVGEKVRENAMYLAYGASVIANILNPELIILGGRIKEFGSRYLDWFQEKFEGYVMSRELPRRNLTDVMVSGFGREGTALGGAVLILSRVFNLDFSDITPAT